MPTNPGIGGAQSVERASGSSLSFTIGVGAVTVDLATPSASGWSSMPPPVSQWAPPV